MDNVVHTFVVPTPTGAAHAVAAPSPNPRRAILLGLLQGGASQPVPMGRLAELAQLADRRAAGAELFRLQRDGWVSGELEPFAPPTGSPNESLPTLLAQLSECGRGILADDRGLCVANSGYAPEQARQLSALAQILHPAQQKVGHALSDSETAPLRMLIQGADAEHSLSIRQLYLGQRRFHLLLAGTNSSESPVFVLLIAVLARRYLGEV
jgi:hypothetical protein